tara:strand:+ start:1050 stop:1913 length:864 start_codon:yes stop_codon:yes gene_type:complete
MKSSPAPLNSWIDEYHQDIRYGMKGKILIDEKSAFQRITLIESKRYGKGLLLDGCWMTAEHQERHYHECLVHPAICGAKNLDKVLIIGGGDGGTARECLRHKALKHLDMVEIDERVVQLSQKYLPSLGDKAWDDPRLNLWIQDGIAWVKNTPDSSYDVVIIDGSDPAGPSKGLFNKTFFINCRRILKPGGIFATQSESPEAFRHVHIEIVRTIREIFEYADPLYGWVPMYPSGWWSWTFASIGEPHYKNPISFRVQEIAQECDIWSIRWQQGAFKAMPAFIERELNK